MRFFEASQTARPFGLRWLCLAIVLVVNPSFPSLRAEVQILPAREPERVFSGGVRTVPVVWRNSSDLPTNLTLSMRLYQASSATAAPLTLTPWKELNILPGQTVLESVSVNVPAVKAETQFLLQWLQGSNNVVGVTEIGAYPTNILRELEVLAGVEAVAVYDPLNRLKPLLHAVGVDFSDVAENGLEHFLGKLAIIGPFESKAQMREWLPGSIRGVASKGAGVVWIQPPSQPGEEKKPSFYTVLEGKGAVVVVQAGVIGDLEQDPQAQLNLVRLCRQAVKPQPLRLPFLASQP
jgi:hypothetical protein